MLSLLNLLDSSRKAKLRHIGRKIGLDIRLNALNARDDLRLVHFLKLFDIELVLDVGANKGQFAKSLIETGYRGRIISFEALPEAHAILSEAAAGKAAWTIAPCVALSDKSGVAQFHVTKEDTSSSLFPPSEAFLSATPHVRVTETIEVRTARLDEVVREASISLEDCFLKLDIQGSEPLVLGGAPNVLSAARGLMTELSLTPLYDGQPSARELLEAVYAAGFEVWDVWQGYRNPQTHRLNQIDIVCFKSNNKAIL